MRTSRFRKVIRRAWGPALVLPFLGCTAHAEPMNHDVPDKLVMDQSPASAPGVDQGAAGDFEDIVVTARRVAERQLTVPITINSIAGKDLDRLQVRTTDDLAFRVPALQIAQDPNRSNSFTIRGVGRTNQGEPGVVTYIAEVPQEVYGGAPLFDLQAVEVLKGPQGTLFGKNSVGGAVLIVPQRPTNIFEGMANLRLGNRSARELTGVINLPVNEAWSLRLAGRISRRGALVRNVAGPDLDTLSRQAARLSLSFHPSERVDNYFMADGYSSSEYAPAASFLRGVATCPESGIACLYDLIGRPLSDPLVEQEALGRNAVAQPRARRSTIRVWGVTDHLTIDGPVTVKNIVAYREARQHIRRDLDGFRYFLFETDKPEFHKQFTDELQFQGISLNGRLRWVLGGFFSDVHDASRNAHQFLFADVPPGVPGLPAAPTIIDGLVVSKSRALFGQATYDLSKVLDGLKITGGLRYTWDDRKFIGASFDGIRNIAACRNRITAGPSAGGFLSGTDPATCVRTLRDRFEKPTWNINLEYRLSPEVFAYVTTRRGYKSGNFNIAAAGSDLISYRPETLTDLEAGIKAAGRLGGMGYRFAGSAYVGRYRDIQSVVNRTDNGVFGAFIVNAGRATVKGLELDATLRPSTGIEIGGYYALTDGRYAKDIVLGSQFAGRPLLAVAKHTAGARARLSKALPSERGTISLMSNINYQGRTPTSYDGPDAAFSAIDGFARVDATLEWENLAGRNINMRLYVENLFNKRPLVSLNDLRNSLGFVGGSYLAARSYGFEIGLRF